MPTLEALYRQDPESLPFRQPVDPMLLGIPVSIRNYIHTNVVSDITVPTENTVEHDLLIPTNVSLLLYRTTLKLWRIPLTYPPSNASWIPVNTRSRGSMSKMCGSCSTTPGCTTAKHPVSTSTAPNWQKCLKQRLILSCRAWATAAAGRWDNTGIEICTFYCIFLVSSHLSLPVCGSWHEYNSFCNNDMYC